MEKFMDHTDIGMNQPSTCKSANPTAIPANARISGRPAASSMPNATNSRIMVGRPLTSSALWSASALILLKSLHTGHSPVTFAFAPGRERQLPDVGAELAGRHRTAGVVLHDLVDGNRARCDRHARSSPRAAGSASGFGTARGVRRVLQLRDEPIERRRVRRDRGRLVVDDDRIFGAERAGSRGGSRRAHVARSSPAPPTRRPTTRRSASARAAAANATSIHTAMTPRRCRAENGDDARTAPSDRAAPTARARSVDVVRDGHANAPRGSGDGRRSTGPGLGPARSENTFPGRGRTALRWPWWHGHIGRAVGNFNFGFGGSCCHSVTGWLMLTESVASRSSPVN